MLHLKKVENEGLIMVMIQFKAIAIVRSVWVLPKI